VADPQQSELIGQAVHDDAGTSVGTVRAVLPDPSGAGPSWVAVEVFADGGGVRVAPLVEALQSQGQLAVAVSADKLYGSPVRSDVPLGAADRAALVAWFGEPAGWPTTSDVERGNMAPFDVAPELRDAGPRG
jgi:hypothetical protein